MLSTSRSAVIFWTLVTVSCYSYAQDAEIDPQEMMQKMQEHGMVVDRSAIMTL